MAVRRRRRHVGRFDAQRAKPRERLAQAAVALGDKQAASPRTRPQDCHSATMSSLALERKQRQRQRRVAVLEHDGDGGRRLVRFPGEADGDAAERGDAAYSTPCACRAPSGAPRRARDADRRRAGARRPLRPRLRNARARRKGRAAVGSPSRLRDGIPRRGPTRQRSCRLPFDAPNNSAPARLLPPGCRENARARSQSA